MKVSYHKAAELGEMFESGFSEIHLNLKVKERYSDLISQERIVKNLSLMRMVLIDSGEHKFTICYRGGQGEILEAYNKWIQFGNLGYDFIDYIRAFTEIKLVMLIENYP